MSKSKDACAGCYNDDYNHGLGGAKECFSFSSAEIIKRLAVGVNQVPPFNKNLAEPMMSCYTQRGMCYVKPEDLTEKGFWK